MENTLDDAAGNLEYTPLCFSQFIGAGRTAFGEREESPYARCEIHSALIMEDCQQSAIMAAQMVMTDSLDPLEVSLNI